MIKATVTDNQCDLEMNGSFLDILANTCVLISAVYESVMENNKAAAEAFRQVLQEETANPDSPFWNEEVPQKKDVRVGMVNMAGCKNREQAAGLVMEAEPFPQKQTAKSFQKQNESKRSKVLRSGGV